MGSQVRWDLRRRIGSGHVSIRTKAIRVGAIYTGIYLSRRGFCLLPSGSPDELVGPPAGPGVSGDDHHPLVLHAALIRALLLRDHLQEASTSSRHQTLDEACRRCLCGRLSGAGSEAEQRLVTVTLIPPNDNSALFSSAFLSRLLSSVRVWVHASGRRMYRSPSSERVTRGRWWW